MQKIDNFKLEKEKLNYLYNNVSSAMLGAIAIALLMYFTIRKHVDIEVLNIWLFLQFLIVFLRLILIKSYKKNTITPNNIQTYHMLFLFFVLFTAFLWAVVPFILPPQKIELYTLMLLMIGGLSSGALLSLASKPYMFNIFILISLVPFSYALYGMENYITDAMLISCLFYILFLLVISKKTSKKVIDNISLEFNNQDLIKELEEKAKEANTANESKSKFLSVMSHEIRTPLNAIIGFVKILKKDEEDLTKKKYLDTIDSSSFLLMSVINDILDITKIEAGKFVIESIEYKPSQELYSVYELYEKTASQKGINLINSISIELPMYLKGDMLRLKQIISNLLSNAIKFTPKGKNIEFIAKCNKEKSILYIDIRDEGIGIADENIAKITKEFTQADSTTARKYGGTGLGLSIVTKLLNLQNSELKIKSKIGQGSNFYFELPVKCTKNKTIKDTPKIEYNFKGKKILVAEDNKTNQMLIEILLDDIGLNVKIANDGLEVEKLFKQDKYDLILMDINMPNKNGLEAMLSIKKLNNKIPIIALTANAVSGDKEKYIDDGFDDYLSKPINTDKLNEVLYKHMN